MNQEWRQIYGFVFAFVAVPVIGMGLFGVLYLVLRKPVRAWVDRVFWRIVWEDDPLIRQSRAFPLSLDRSAGRRIAHQGAGTNLEWQALLESADVRPLGAGRREHYLTRWRRVQAEFVTAPAAALRDADRLATALMHEQGHALVLPHRPTPLAGDIGPTLEGFGDLYRLARIAGVARGISGAPHQAASAFEPALEFYRAVFDRLLSAPTS